ncbi:MAG: preprotein translocase subunit SecY [Proteobacteria bacterium]|nr:preprotein translocase subunit SecY [Pseudomonadota bacterium]
MPSAAEQLAANFNFGNLSKATELRQRIFFTLVALIVARLGTYIPMPGIDPAGIKHLMDSAAGGFLNVFNVLAGGAVSRMAVFSLGIMPYISASIIMQLMTTVIPRFEELKKEGAAGQKIINQYTRYGTVGLAAAQALGIAIGLENSPGLVIEPGLFFRLETVITLTGGTVLLMWLGEQITNRGVGNGISLIIFAGIVARFPQYIGQAFEAVRTNTIGFPTLLIGTVFIAALIAFIVFMERAQRRLLVQYPKRQVSSGRMSGGESSHLPLKLNVSGVIPPIFASSILTVPTLLAGFNAAAIPDWAQTVLTYISHGTPLYLVLYALLIVFFAFFYTSIMFNPEETADNLKKYGGFIPGIRPGKKTAEHIDYVLTRITVIGAAYLAAVCLIPEIAIGYYSIPFYLGGTSILIVVSVTMDTVAQIQSHLIAQQYEGLIKKAKLRGARR